MECRIRRGKSKDFVLVREEILKILKDGNFTTNHITKVLKENGLSVCNVTAKSYLEEMENNKLIKSMKAPNSTFTIVFWSLA